MKIVIDNSALFSRKNGVHRYSECIINGLIRKLGKDNLKLFPAPKLIEFFKNKAQFDENKHQYFQGLNLKISNIFCNLKENIELINSEIKGGNGNTLHPLYKLKREQLRFFKNLMELLFNDKKIIRKSLEKEKIYHCLYGYIPHEIKQIKGLNLFITIHDIIPVLNPNLIEGGQAYCNAKEINQIKELDNREIIFTPSIHSKNDLCNFNKKIDPQNVHVIYLAAIEQFRPVTDQNFITQTKEKHQIPSDCQYVLSTLSSDPKKNVPFFINNFLDLISSERLTDLKLVLMGKKSALASLPKDVQEKMLKYKHQIILTNFVEDEEVSILHSAALCFCFPSLYEGFGIPILEAMQCGTPVITSNISSLPEVAGDAALLVDPQNSDDLKQAILNIYQNKSLQTDLSKRGIKRAAQFSWDTCVDQMIEVYTRYSPHRAF